MGGASGRRKSLHVALIFLFSSIFTSSAYGEEPQSILGVGDLNVAGYYSLAPCKSPTDLDCIESVGFVSDTQEFKKAEFSKFEGNTRIESITNNVIHDFTSFWMIENSEIRIRALLMTPKHKLWIVNSNRTGAALKLYPVTWENMEKQPIRITVRTSFLKPMNVQLRVEDMHFSQEPISGGNRFILEGRGMTRSYFDAPYSDPESISKYYSEKYAANARADKEMLFFEANLHHAGKDGNDSWFEPVCADQGYSVQSMNSWGAGDPVWDGDSLNFAVEAPHFKSNGELNQGYFYFKASHKYLDCKFPGNLLTKSPKVEIQIFDESGVQQVATTVVDNSNGMLIVEAKGFHYSAPTIKVKPVMLQNVSQAQGAAAKPKTMKRKATNKKKTITCSKGKSIRKVSGINPQCPRGYALKEK